LRICDSVMYSSIRLHAMGTVCRAHGVSEVYCPY
jgi:hypothetical protein